MDAIAGYVSGFAATSLLFATLLAITLVVFLSSRWRSVSRPDTLEGEREVDRIELRGVCGVVRLTLTDRRLLRQHARWPLAARGETSLSLVDAHAATFTTGVNILLLLFGLFLVRFPPAALLLCMLALESPMSLLAIPSAFARRPFGGVCVLGWGRDQARALFRFARSARSAIEVVHRLRLIGPANGVSAVPSDDELEPSHSWGRAVWLGVVGLMAVAAMQRVLQGHVSYDDLIFAPILIGVPLAISKLGVRDGAWAGLLGFVGVMAIKHPGPLGGDGRPYIVQGLLLGAVLLLMAVAGGLLAVHVHPLAAPLAACLWPVAVAIDCTPAWSDHRAFAIAVLSMAVAMCLPPWPAARVSRVATA